jgi:hypothetical protein
MSQPAIQIKGMDLSGYMVKDAPRAIAWYRPGRGIRPSGRYDFWLMGRWGPGDDFDGAVAAIEARGVPIVMQNETPVCKVT